MAEFVAISDTSSIINYRCGFCGNNAEFHGDSWGSNLPQCEICRKPLCKQCNQYGLCPDHFNQLALPDQYLLKSSYQDNRTSPIIILIIVGFLIFPMGLLFGIIPIGIGNIWISIMVFPVIIVTIFIILIVKRMNSRTRNYREILTQIIARNQLRNDFNRKNNRESWHSYQNPTQFCYNCGNIIKSGQSFCPGCGIDLLRE